MALSDFYPSPAALIESELRVLNYLRNDRFITERQSQFAQDAGMYYGRYRRDHSHFEFFSYFDVTGAGSKQRKRMPDLRLTLAALIEAKKNGSYSNVTYCLSVCKIRRLVILRKFHFDVTVTSDAVEHRRQEHPQCHLQYCGEMIPHMAKMGCRQKQLEQMHPSLSEPRIFFWPMSLALLIDMALHEFPDRHSANFRSSSEWRNIVRAQESLVLRPFYEKCVEVIVDRRGNNRTLADEFYVG